jgi:hypothetical protein
MVLEPPMKQQSIGTAVLVLVMAVMLAGCSPLEQYDLDQRQIASDGRIELPEAGIALAFPDDWMLEARPTTRNVGLASVLDPEARDMLVPVVAAVPGHRHDHCVVVDFAPLVQARPDWSTLDDVVAGFAAMLGSDPRWLGLDSTIIDLPLGRAGRILRDRAGEAESVSTYVFTQVDAWLYLECVAHSVPSEDWRSIAETFEFLPAAEASTLDGSVAHRSPAVEGPPTPTPVADAAVFIDAMCTAFDELLTAVGNPDTGEGSELSRTLEDAIVRGDTALVDTTTEAMLGHLQAARSAAMRAASFPSAAAGMSEFDDFLVIVADGVVAERDAAPDGLDAAIAAANRDWARAYETWRGWITEIGPLWNEVAGDMPIPCPSPRG